MVYSGDPRLATLLLVGMFFLSLGISDARADDRDYVSEPSGIETLKFPLNQGTVTTLASGEGA